MASHPKRPDSSDDCRVTALNPLQILCTDQGERPADFGMRSPVINGNMPMGNLVKCGRLEVGTWMYIYDHVSMYTHRWIDG